MVGTFAGGPPPGLASRAQERDMIAFSYPTGGIGYAFRAASLPYDLDYNPLQPCADPQPLDYSSLGSTLAQVRALAPSALAQVDDLTTLRALLWDTYRTLQNFVPGFQALAAGRGDSLVITPDMVDQANNIADRLVAAGSPALGAAINTERGKYNYLQAFAGKTFAQAATLLGIAIHSTYLPLIRR